MIIERRIMKCKHCGEYVGEFYGNLDIHLWTKHREIMLHFLNDQMVDEKQ